MPINILDFHFTKASELYQLNVFKHDSAQPLGSATLSIPPVYTSTFDLGLLDLDAKDPAGRVDRIATYGRRLYQKVFTTEIARVWSEHKKASELAVLCIRIAPEASELEAIPWETLFDGEEFLAAGARSTISRLPLDVQRLNAPPAVPTPLRLLVLISSPLDLPEESRLQMEREQEILLEALNDPSGQGKLQADFEEEAKLEILESSLETPYQILHFSGHGIASQVSGGLLLEDARGNRRPTSVTEIMQSIQRGERSLRLVVLSGCQTTRTLEIDGLHDMARGLLRRGIPSVIAMQFSILDRSGLKFAEVFYSRIVAGRPLEMAIHAARRTLMLSDDYFLKADALAPVLLAANGDCLRTTQETKSSKVGAPELDAAFLLPLAQLSYGFYGRRGEYRQVRDAIVQRNQRAVIIHGIGGIGKTALVSHVATRLRRHFQGVFAFDCSSGTLAPEMAMLELHRYFESQGVKALEQIVSSKLAPAVLANYLGQVLSQWSLLLIFDNFESLLERAGDRFHIREQDLRAFITTLVKTTATRSHFLFTSRYLFDLDDRRLGPIESLHLRDLSRPEALSLMQKLPQLGRASHEEKRRALRTFGGHPYALVTLDRHCQYRPLDQALADAEEIHGELREFLAIELNYARLSDRARQLLTGLAAFRQSVPYEAAEWVLGERIPIPTEIVEQIKSETTKFAEFDNATFAAMVNRALPEQRKADKLDRPIEELVEWGLLTPIYENGKVKRLSIHALVREFCRDKHTVKVWRELVSDAAAFYRNSTKLIKTEDKSPAAVWAEMEAFELLMEIENFEGAADLLLGATDLLTRWGFVHYLDTQHRRLLNLLDGERAAIVLHNLGYLLQSRGDYDQALEYYERSLKIKEDLGNRLGVANYLHQIGRIQQERGQFEQAREYYQRSLKIREELGDRSGIAFSLHQIGTIQHVRGEYEQALGHYERSLKILEDLGDRESVAGSLHQIGRIQQDRGDYEHALEHYQRSLKIREELGHRAGVALSLHQIGIIQLLRHDYEQALEYYQRSLKINEELGNRAGVAISLHQIGIIQQERGESEQALDYYQRSLRIKEELGDRLGVASSLHQIGTIQQQRAGYEQALNHYQRSLKIFEELGNRAGVAKALGQIGILLTETRHFAEAFEPLLTSLSIFLDLQSPNATIVMGALITLRDKWGKASFDTAWKKATEMELPEWLA